VVFVRIVVIVTVVVVIVVGLVEGLSDVNDDDRGWIQFWLDVSVVQILLQHRVK
jgi:hypothetical protein